LLAQRQGRRLRVADSHVRRAEHPRARLRRVLRADRQLLDAAREGPGHCERRGHVVAVHLRKRHEVVSDYRERTNMKLKLMITMLVASALTLPVKADKPEIDPSWANGKLVYMIGPHIIQGANVTQPQLYAHAEELYLLVYPINPTG